MQIIFSDVISRVKREMKGDSIYAFARKLGISQQTADCYMNGKRKPSLDFIYRVCSTYGCSADEILGLDESRTTPNSTTSNSSTPNSTTPNSSTLNPSANCRDCPILLDFIKRRSGG